MIANKLGYKGVKNELQCSVVVHCPYCGTPAMSNCFLAGFVVISSSVLQVIRASCTVCPGTTVTPWLKAYNEPACWRCPITPV